MKDQDLEDIGRRLYDLEADPPKNGWDKLGAAIRTPKPSAKLIWLERNWWKPLVVLPFLFFLWMSQTTADKSHATASLAKLTNEDQEKSSPSNTESNTQPTTIAKEDKVVSTDEVLVSEKVNNEVPAEKRRRQISSHVDQQQNATAARVSKDEQLVIEQPQPVISTTENNNAIQTSSLKTSVIHSSEQLMNEASVLTPKAAIDSLIASEEKKELIEVVVPDSTETTEEENSYFNPWRLTAAVMPQFIWRSVSPNQNDEVFVTDVQDQKKGFTHLAGYSFSLGVSRAISPQWQLDGQISFSKTKQEVHFSYANGNVDTLLAVVQADQSVRLVPVYEQIQQHTVNKYSFIGLRFGVTHYFWAKNKRRFSLSGSLGTNYLVSASVKEQTDAGWSELPSDGLQKLHYNFSVGAGYNYNFAPGWELMVSPTLLYNLRPLKNDQLPYQTTQRAFGLNVMVSKSLGRN